MKHKCKCGSDRFIRRWVGVDVHTPCTIDLKSKAIRMDYSREEQSEDSGSYIEFYCAQCQAEIDSDLTLDLVTEYEYE